MLKVLGFGGVRCRGVGLRGCRGVGVSDVRCQGCWVLGVSGVWWVLVWKHDAVAVNIRPRLMWFVGGSEAAAGAVSLHYLHTQHPHGRHTNTHTCSLLIPVGRIILGPVSPSSGFNKELVTLIRSDLLVIVYSLI